jgi:GNAT superfamily N-acetyltransferase
MTRIVEWRGPGDDRFAMPADWPALTPADRDTAQPMAHWLAIDRHGAALARAAIWPPRALGAGAAPVALVGHFAADDIIAGRRVLEHVARQAGRSGAQWVIGPVDGSTWARYRCTIVSDGAPPFPLEPVTPLAWCDAFAQAGFAPWACYRSAVCADIAAELARHAPTVARIARRAAISPRPIDPARHGDDCHRLHALVLDSFSQSRLFSAVDAKQFARRFDALAAQVVPGLAWLAERDGQALGFVFGLPGQGPTWAGSLIVKTLGVAPAAAANGVGLLLMQRLLRSAQALGLDQAVLALMDESSLSSRMVARRIRSRTFRRYALFARRTG